MSTAIKEFSQSFFHGTKAQLRVGEMIAAGNESNYGERLRSNYVYFTSNFAVAVWGAELAIGEGPGRIYVVEPSGEVEDDPNVTNKRFPGNPNRSFRSLAPLRVIGEVTSWEAHSPEEIKARQESIEKMLKEGAQIID